MLQNKNACKMKKKKKWNPIYQNGHSTKNMKTPMPICSVPHFNSE